MTTNPTAGPLTVAEFSDDYFAASNHKYRIEADSKPTRTVAVVEGFGDESSANARLLAAAYSSYDRHFADPVAAAEADLLGEALQIIRAFHGQQSRFGHPSYLAVSAARNAALDVLAQTKEPA